MKVLVTGAAGFVGRRLCSELTKNGHAVRGLVHDANTATTHGVQTLCGDITEERVARTATDGVDAVVHLAARAHVMRDDARNPIIEYRRVNVEGTRVMLEAARQSGVSCFILASSVKAVGEASSDPWNSATTPRPVDPYGISKLEAEALLTNVSGTMHAAILRFPLVYGPGVRGNMLRLFELIDAGWPIPVDSAANARSLLFVGNAAAAIRCVLETSFVTEDVRSRKPFFLSDGSPISTASLVADIADALGTRARTLKLPIRALGRLVNSNPLAPAPLKRRFGGILNRLGGSLEVDESEFARAFGFVPPYTRETGLAETAQWFRSK